MKILTALALLLALPAAAAEPPPGQPFAGAVQPPAPPFIPITIDEQEYRRMMEWLGDQPLKFALPVAQWLGGLEQKAGRPPMPAPRK